MNDILNIALKKGIVHKGYYNASCCWVDSYSGETTFEHNGKIWRAIGHEPQGSINNIIKNGYVEITPLD